MLPLNSQQLRTSAAAITQARQNHHAQLAAQQESLQAFFSQVVGEAFASSQDFLERIGNRWAQTDQHLATTAQVLSITARAQDTLESLLESLRFSQERADNSRDLTLLIRDLHTMGRVLDQVCAWQLEAICTPETTPPPRPLGVDSTLEETHAQNLASLANYPVLADFLDDPDFYLLELSDSHLVAAFGDIDHAEAVLTMVAGVGSSSNWEGYLERGSRLHEATGAATVVWLGYQAPSTVPAALGTLPAKAGAQNLVQFQDTLATRNPSARTVVLGHSYGSTLVGYARSDLAVDSIIYAGSPGIPKGNGRARETTVLGDKDWIGLTGTQWTAIHGVDPATLNTHTQLRTTGGHSDYFSDSLLLEHLRKELGTTSP